MVSGCNARKGAGGILRGSRNIHPLGVETLRLPHGDGRSFHAAFWLSTVFMLTLALFIGVAATLFPRFFYDYFLFQGLGYDDGLQHLVQLRGVFCLLMFFTFITAFYRRSRLARVTVYFATCFVAVNFFNDLQRIGFNGDWLKTYTASAYLLMRPIMMLALMCMSYGFYDNAHLERHRDKT